MCTSYVVLIMLLSFRQTVCDIDVYRDVFVRLGMFVVCIAGSRVYVNCSE